MVKYVVSDAYDVDIGPHVFPTVKYPLIRQRLMDEDGAADSDFIEPERCDEEDVLRVHTREYFLKCRDDRLSPWEIMQLELPWSQELYDASCRCVQGSILAAGLALERGVGLHIGGGFHHAFPDHGEGFCVFNDPACAIRKMQAEERIVRALVADCDLHHGNGTAAVFAEDDRVATFSIHQKNIYPAVKPPSTVDVGIPPGTDDGTYLAHLEDRLLPLIDRHRPELLVYLAGADPYVEDQLGSLALTKEGLHHRDRLITEACSERDIPLMVVLAGGYARRLDDTVEIHLNSIRAARELWRPASS